MPFGVSEKFLRTSSVSFDFANLTRAESVDPHAHRLSHADCISQLYLGLVGQPRCHNVLGDVAGHISRRTVHLGRILAAESAAAVTARAAVGVDDDLAARQAGVAHRSANHKSSRRIDVVLGVLIEPRCGKHCLDYVLENVGVQFFIADVSPRAGC